MNLDVHQRKILIVDDASENIAVLGGILSDYKRQVASNGEKALKIAFGDNKPDLILLDVMMPEMDGFEVCRRLKENPGTKNIPVIFITAKTEVEDETQGLALGAVDFIPKPISPPVVIARVKNQLELLAAREILEAQNNELAQRNKYITDSINYAKRIQSAILPSPDVMDRLFPEHFLIFLPKDIVSGDFYWLSEINDKKIFSVIDCTGHGVPGALMSMIGNTLLNEIVNIMQIFSPGEILNLLDYAIIKELRKDINRETYEGMDMVVGVFNENANKITFATAYRPVYYFQNGVFKEIKGERKSIGDPKKKIIYNNYEIEINTQTDVYLFSDGIPDQNNSEDKKFGSARFKNLLLLNHLKAPVEQKNIIQKEFLEYKGEEPQRDDVTLMGIRFNPVLFQQIISYHGPARHEIILSLCDDLDVKLEQHISPKLKKTIFFCVNELLQNIYFYSEEKIIEDTKEIGVGSIDVSVKGDYIEIKALNRTTDTSFANLHEKISLYNSMSPDELKSLRKEKMSMETEATSKGGGIGFLEIVRRTNYPVMITKYVYDLQNINVQILLKIKKG